nr:MDIS1-interacting receptor like kinase 2-like [Ipomoea batatas]
MTYESIIEATGNFDSSYCIGVGGHGSVFRAELPSGQIFAVKKFHTLGMQDDESWHDLRKFAYTAEVNCKCDVYSFGVVTLEVIMGKHPGDLITCLSTSSFSAIDGMIFKDLLTMDISKMDAGDASFTALLFSSFSVASISKERDHNNAGS